MTVDPQLAVADQQVLVQAHVHAVAHADAVALVVEGLVAPQQVVAALVDGHAVGLVAVRLVVGDDVVHAAAVDNDAGEVVLVGAVVEDPAVVDLTRDDDAVLLHRAVGGVLGDDQAPRAVVRVDAVDQVFAVGVAADHHVVGLVAVEAVPHVVPQRVEQPAGGVATLHLRVHRRAVLGYREAVGLALGVAEAGDGRADHVGLGTAPGVDERTEAPLLLEPVLAVFLLAPSGNAAIGDEQLAVVDDEGAAITGEAEILGRLVDMQGRTRHHHQRPAQQIDPRRRFAQLLGTERLGQAGRGDVATLHQDRLGHAALAHHPLTQAFVAAGELAELVETDHAPHADAGCRLALDPGLYCRRGERRQVGQLRCIQLQRLDRCAADPVGLGRYIGIHRQGLASQQAGAETEGDHAFAVHHAALLSSARSGRA